MRHEEFFDYARERHQTYLNRARGLPPPWSNDPILQQFRFTNIFRELDSTTVWFRKNVRSKIGEPGLVLLATVVFRWFNRIETGRIVFQQTVMTDRGVMTPFEHFAETGSGEAIVHALRTAIPKGPWVTGSYMIRSPNDYPKLEGMVKLCEGFWSQAHWRTTGRLLSDGDMDRSLELFTRWLEKFPGMGPFLAYEVACDLRYTPLLNLALDSSTWANVGPGALRGLGRLHGRSNADPRRPKHKWAVSVPEKQAVREMRELLALSRDPKYWPQTACNLDQCEDCQDDPVCSEGWPAWEMREVEHTLCEFDKYERVRLGEGRPRQIFRSGGGLTTLVR